jgi:release factor glutamine methyltransferase
MTDEIASSGPQAKDPPGEDLPLDALLAESAARLAAAGIDSPRREARLLAALALDLDTDALHRLARTHPVPSARVRRLVGRRAAREPMALIAGTSGFWTLDLLVDRSTLIPRPDTETLIEAALHHRPDPTRIKTILDLGTGTGALLLAALSEYPAAYGIGIDRSEAACRLARANALRNSLAARAAFLTADWTAPLTGTFDLILSNPPYIDTADLPGLMPEVAQHEPRSALDGGPGGLDAYRALLPGLARHLAPAGLAILEFGVGQAESVIALARQTGLAPAGRHDDLSGTTRAVALERATLKTVGSRIGLG